MNEQTPDMVLVPMKDLLNMEDALEAPTFEDVKVIAYKPQIASYLGSIEAAIYFQQLSHWQKYAKRTDGFFYKSAQEIYQETFISEKIQRRCREQLVRIHWLEVEKKMANGHPTYHFKVLVKSFGVLMPTGERPVDPVPTGERPVPIGQTASSITKNTHKNNNYNADSGSPQTSEEIDKLYRLYLISMKIDPQLWNRSDDEEKRTLLHAAKSKYRLTDKRKAKTKLRLKDCGYDMCKKAIINIGLSDWHRDNHDGQWHANLEWIFNSVEKTEEWANKGE